MSIAYRPDEEVAEHCLVLDSEGHLVIANDATRTLLVGSDGSQPVSLRGILLRLGAPPEAADAMETSLDAARRGQSITLEVPVDRGGVPRLCSYMIMPVSDGEGRRLVAVLGRDVTAREALSDERQIFFSLVEASSDFIGIGDSDGRSVYVNPAGRRMIGLAPDEDVRETQIADCYPDDLRDFARNVILKEMHETGRWAGETFFQNMRTGARIPVSDTHFMVRHPKSARLLGHATITRDISGLRQTEEALRSANHRKDDFIATLGHELRNPIAALTAAVDLIEQRGDDPTTVARFRDLFRRQLRTLVRLVDDLLDVARISRGKLILDKKLVSIDTIVTDAISAVRHAAEMQGCEVVLEAAGSVCEVMGDSTRLEQVFVNLLSNAIRHSARGSRIVVKIERQMGDSHVAVEVTDTGAGIAAEILPHIFDPFVQASQSLDRPHGGLGIGLTLVRSLVELHGGQVEARSPGPGLGSVFEVRLPVGAPSPGGSHAAHQLARESVQRKRVVIVEDNDDARALLAMLLRDMGHEAWEASDGLAGLAMIRTVQPDVALVDVGLPMLDGFSLAQQVRSDPDNGSITMYAITGYGGAEMVERARTAGFDAHLTKPLTLLQIRDLLQRR